MSFSLLIFTYCKSASKHPSWLLHYPNNPLLTRMFYLLSCLSPGWIHMTNLISIYMTPNASTFSSTADLVDEVLGASWVYLHWDVKVHLSSSLNAVQNPNSCFHSLAVNVSFQAGSAKRKMLYIFLAAYGHYLAATTNFPDYTKIALVWTGCGGHLEAPIMNIWFVSLCCSLNLNRDK